MLILPRSSHRYAHVAHRTAAMPPRRQGVVACGRTPPAHTRGGGDATVEWGQPSGSRSGIVTLEELVGEIRDEFDPSYEPVRGRITDALGRIPET